MLANEFATAALALRTFVVDLLNFKRLRKNISSRKDYWLKLLSQGPLEVPESKDSIFRDALNRLRVSRIKPERLKALEEYMFDKHVDEAVEAEIWLKAEAKGREQGRIEIALDMLADNKPIEEIVKYTHLPESKVIELKNRWRKNRTSNSLVIALRA